MGGEGRGRKLRALVAIENLRLAMACQRVFERGQAEGHVHRVRQPLRKNGSGRPINNRHEIEKAPPR
jgi:hypothetical protein